MESFEINTSKPITINELYKVVNSNRKIKLSEFNSLLIEKCRSFLDEFVSENVAVYGVNTGFGSLCNTKINNEDLGKLQENLMRSHACGFGNEVSQEIVKWMLLLKIIGISKGHSGVQLITVQRLIDFYNEGIFPVVYEYGSLGASGDLAPLAHLCLPLIGEGEFYYKGRKFNASVLQQIFGYVPISLKSKEGLALLNGTQFMSAFGCKMISDIIQLIKSASLAAAASLDAFDCRRDPFIYSIHQLRNNSQWQYNDYFNLFTKDSEIAKNAKEQVQDPYSFRCIPQVLGASLNSIKHIKAVFEEEINAVTDNPIVLPDENKIVSGGNFHGQPLALALDMLTLAISEIGSISERRIYLLISGSRKLPAFLTPNPGLNSGFMIPQYTAAGLASMNKQLCTPSSADSIVSSNGQEDHVSMGANAALKAQKVLDNTFGIIAIEWLTANQALFFRNEKSSPVVEEKRKIFSQIVPFLDKDTFLYPLIQQALMFVKTQENLPEPPID